MIISEGVIGRYQYYTLVEVGYSRFYAILNSKKTISCLRYLECLIEHLKEYGDWSYRAKLDYSWIREEKVLLTIKSIEANLSKLIEQLKSSCCDGRPR